MIVLTIRTDKPEAEITLRDGDKQLACKTWPAHRILAVTLNSKIKEILDMSSISTKQLQGIVCFKGPGSFTGLRIGLTVGNTLAYSLGIPIVARGGEDWIKHGTADIKAGKNDKIAVPEYGSPAKTTAPRK